MTSGTKRRVPVILALAVVLVLIGTMTGCGGDETTTTSSASTTTSSPSAASSTTESASDSTMVVGGKSLANYEAEIPILELALQENPEDLDLLLQLAVAQYQLRRYEEAVATYDRMLQISDEAFFHNNLGNVYRDWGKTDEAKAEYEKAISLDPTLTTAYVNLAQVYKSEDDLAAAMEVMDRGLEAITAADDQERLESIKDKMTSTTT